MKNDKQQPITTIVSNDRGFYNDLRVFDRKDNLLKNWTGLATLGFCMYDDNEGYQEWNVTDTPDRDKNSGYRVRECYVAVSDQAPLSNETKVVESVEQAAERYCDEVDSKLNQIRAEINPYYAFIAGNNRCESIYEQKLTIANENGFKQGYDEAVRLMQASQFKNTEVVKVITDRISEYTPLTKEKGISESLLKSLSDKIDVLNEILKLIQP